MEGPLATSKHWVPGDKPTPTPEQIRAAREGAGLTQTDAGDLVFSTLRTWQNWESGIRPMSPAMWALFRHHLSLKYPHAPVDWFGEKSRQAYPGVMVAFGIELNSRYDRAHELVEMLQFAECAAKAGCEKYVKKVLYDSKADLCTFNLAPEVRDGDLIAERLLKCAKLTIRQFDWFGVVLGHGTI